MSIISILTPRSPVSTLYISFIFTDFFLNVASTFIFYIISRISGIDF